MNIPIYDRLAELAFKKAFGQLTEEEARELNDIIESSPRKKALFDELMDHEKTAEGVMIMDEFDVEASWEKISKPVPPLRKKWGWIQYTLMAASVVLVIGLVALYFFLEKNNKPAIVQNENNASTGSVTIGDSVAVITNSDGSAMAVGQSQSGIIGNINGEPAIKNDSVLICPNIASAGLAIKTLPGKELRIQLSDGTMAWLSGNSELSFIDGFTANKRALALKGEVYFEVKKGNNPFKVQAGEMDIEVLGTHFNVRAYNAQDLVKTTLMEGKIKLKAGEQTMLLSKGEEAILVNHTLSMQPIGQRSVNKVEGKKTDQFIFDNEGIKTILGEVAENYNCSIEYNGKLPASTFSASFSRSSPIGQLLNNLSREMKIDLTLHGNTIIVDYTKAR
ncbi:MAG TPA: FecR family protein [Niastella sp.]